VLIDEQIDRQTDKHTDTTENNITLAARMANMYNSRLTLTQNYCAWRLQSISLELHASEFSPLLCFGVHRYE